MIKKRLLFFGLVLLMASCSASGPRFLEMQRTMKPVPSGYSRIYFFRPGRFMAMAADARVTLDGQVIGRCENGGFFWEDVPAGKHLISVDYWGNFGQWDTSVELQSGKETFFQIEPRDSMSIATVALGPIGQLGEAAVASESRSGTFQLKLVERQYGVQQLNELSYSKN